MSSEILNELLAVQPANILLLSAVLLLSLGLFKHLESNRNFFGWLAMASLSCAAITNLSGVGDSESVALFARDQVSISTNWLAILGGGLLILIGWEYVPRSRSSEYYSCLLFLLSGIMYAAAASDLTTLFLGLELASIPTTVLLGITRSSALGREATLKYFTLAAFTSAIFLFGCSYLYGAAGSTSLISITNLRENSQWINVGLAISICGLCFRITAVPFHFYASDVFNGASLPLAATLSYLPKVAGTVGIVKLLGGSSLDFGPANSTIPLLITAAVLTMTLGNCLAVIQTNTRRLLAYSSIAHSGYLLTGIAALLSKGQSVAPLFDYLATYAVMTLGMFAVLAFLENKSETKSSDLTLFDGLYFRRPLLAICMTTALLSLTGLPMTAGFWAKFQVFAAAVWSGRSDLRIVALVMAINAAIGAVYYLAIVSRMFSPSGNRVIAPSTRSHFGPSVACTLCSVLTVVWFFLP